MKNFLGTIVLATFISSSAFAATTPGVCYITLAGKAGPHDYREAGVPRQVSTLNDCLEYAKSNMGERSDLGMCGHNGECFPVMVTKVGFSYNDGSTTTSGQTESDSK